MAIIPASITHSFNAFFWNYTKIQGQALINKGLEICTQQKVGNSFWNIGIVALTGVAAGASTAIVNAIFHKITLGIYRQVYQNEPDIKKEILIHRSTLFNIASIIFSGCAFMTGAAGGYQVALKINHKLEIFSADDVIKFTLYPLFASTISLFLPITSWSGVVVGMAAALPFGAWNGALKSHSLYLTAFSAALFASGLRSGLASLYHKF